MTNASLGFDGFLSRWIVCAALVLATYNGSSINLISWFMTGSSNELPFMLLVGAAFAIAYLFVLRATAQSLGVIGVILLAAFFAGAIWSLVSLGLFSIGEHTVMLYLVLIAIATTLAIGMSWSIIQRRITGQVDVAME